MATPSCLFKEMPYLTNRNLLKMGVDVNTTAMMALGQINESQVCGSVEKTIRDACRKLWSENIGKCVGVSAFGRPYLFTVSLVGLIT